MKNNSRFEPMEKYQKSTLEKTDTTTPWYHGHRARMHAKLAEKGADNLTESELLELLLMQALPRRDVKPIVHDLLAQFGHLGNVLGASVDELVQIHGIKENTAYFLKLIHAVAKQSALSQIQDRPLLSNWERLFDYANTIFAGENVEKLYILFLDNQLRLIKSQMHQTGSVNHIPVYPRDILKSALNWNASAVILMHNHPSGDPHPSKDDIAATSEIQKALQDVDIRLIEHLIVGKGHKAHSMKADGIL